MSDQHLEDFKRETVHCYPRNIDRWYTPPNQSMQAVEDGLRQTYEQNLFWFFGLLEFVFQ